MDSFQERQKFNSLWGYVIFALTSVLNLLYISYFEDVSNTIVIVTICTALFILLLFEFCTLYTLINNEQITYKFWPFHRKFISIEKSDIDSIELKQYQPIKDYGGWGIRRSLTQGKAFTTRGNTGILLTTKKEKILIGTQNPDDLLAFLSGNGYLVKNCLSK